MGTKRPYSHYDYLTEHLPAFLETMGVSWKENQGIIRAHGDKAYQYRDRWEETGLHFFHGVAIYLLTYCYPYSKEARETSNGWVAPEKWVIENKGRFLPFLPPVPAGLLE